MAPQSRVIPIVGSGRGHVGPAIGLFARLHTPYWVVANIVLVYVPWTLYLPRTNGNELYVQSGYLRPEISGAECIVECQMLCVYTL